MEETLDSSGYVYDQLRPVKLLLSALLILITRLWLATLSVTLIMFFLRRLSSSHHHDESDVLISSKYLATPALFGSILRHDGINARVIRVSNDACTSFSFRSTFDEIGSDVTIGTVERGGCPFDQKVYYMQEAGFDAVLVYNKEGDDRGQSVRMSAHSLGDLIHVWTGFISRETFLNLDAFVSISHKPGVWFSKDMLINGMVDMIILFGLVVVTGLGFLFIALFINFAHNLLIYGDLLVHETIQEAALIILAISNTTPPLPKLQKITFPTKIITKRDLELNWKHGGIQGQESCPICIEEYSVHDIVRCLPCRHVFHSNW